MPPRRSAAKLLLTDYPDIAKEVEVVESSISERIESPAGEEG